MADYRHVEQQNTDYRPVEQQNADYRQVEQQATDYRHVEQQNVRVNETQAENLKYDRMTGHETAMYQVGQIMNDPNTKADVMRQDNQSGTVYEAGEKTDCFTVVRTSKQLEIPCTRNEHRRYKVSVPKTVHEKVPRRVQYTDYETREREEPYTVKRYETAYRDEEREYMAQVPKKVTKMVKVTKKVPKTVYVDVVTEEPQESTIMVPETRKRWIKVPFQKEVIDQQYRKVKENVPVTKYRTEFDTVTKTVYEDAWRTKVVPVTKIYRREIPVFNVVANPDCGNCDQVDTDNAINTNAVNSRRAEQATYNSGMEANAIVQSHVTQPVDYINRNTNPGQTVEVGPLHRQPSAASGVMHQPVAVPAPSRAAHQIVAGHASTEQGSINQIVNRPQAAPIRTSGRAMGHHNGAQWINQQEVAPVTKETQPQYDPRMQQMYSAPQQYTRPPIMG